MWRELLPLCARSIRTRIIYCVIKMFLIWWLKQSLKQSTGWLFARFSTMIIDGKASFFCGLIIISLRREKKTTEAHFPEYFLFMCHLWKSKLNRPKVINWNRISKGNNNAPSWQSESSYNKWDGSLPVQRVARPWQRARDRKKGNAMYAKRIKIPTTTKNTPHMWGL